MFRLSSLFVAALVASPAFAGGVAPTPPPPPVIVPVEPEQDWTGFYLGGQVDLLANAEASSGDLFLYSYTGHMIGVFAGYRYDLGDIVVGGEVDYMIGTFDIDDIAPNIFLLNDNDPAELLRVGAEVGYDLGDALVYGTAGFARITFDYGGAAGEQDGTGLFYGVGVDYRVSETITVGAEVLQHNFDDFDGSPGFEFDLLTAGINVAFTF